MEGGRPTSRAARELSAALRAANVDVSPRQLERWRQGGLIEETVRKWMPRQGSESSYGQAAFDQASQIKELVDQGLALEQLAIVQFARRRYVTTTALKKALAGQLAEELGPALNAKAWTDARPVAAARAEHITRRLAREPAARELRRELQRLAGEKGERVNQAVARILAGALMVYLVGEPFTRNELTTLLAALGLPVELVPIDDVVTNLRWLDQRRLQQRLESASRGELDQARDDYETVSQWAQEVDYAVLAPATDEYRIAVRLLALLTLRQELGAGEFDAFLDLLTTTTRPAEDPIE